MKKTAIVAVVALMCSAAFGIGVVGKAHGAKLGEGRRMNTTLVDRSKPKAAMQEVAVAEGVWKERPGELFGKKFGEQIKDRVVLMTDKERQERYVTFQPEKCFRRFSAYRQIVDPRTRLVYGLACSSKVKDGTTARAELDEVKNAFKQKFPKACFAGNRIQIGYGEDGGGGLLGAHWVVELSTSAPKSKGQLAAAYEITIRAIDEHFHPSAAAAVSPSSDQDSL